MGRTAGGWLVKQEFSVNAIWEEPKLLVRFEMSLYSKTNTMAREKHMHALEQMKFERISVFDSIDQRDEVALVPWMPQSYVLQGPVCTSIGRECNEACGAVGVPLWPPPLELPFGDFVLHPSGARPAGISRMLTRETKASFTNIVAKKG